MKKQNLLKTLTIVTIAILFTGCGNDCKDEVHLYLPQDFKDCFVFPAGSWWVYTVNGEVYDTLHLESSSLNPPTQEYPDDCSLVESFSATYSTSHYSYFDHYGDVYHYQNSSVNEGDTVYYSLSFYPWYYHMDFNGTFHPAFLSIKYFGAGLYGLNTTDEMKVPEQIEKGGGYWLEALKDTSINNISRKLIIFRTLDFEQIPDGGFKSYIDSLAPFRVYYARGIGMIKKEMYNGDIWEMKDYFINN